MTLTRDEAYNLVESKIKRKNIVKHMLAVEAIMRSLAEYFGEDKEIWGLTGLLHDVDFEEVGENFSMHGLKAEEILKGLVPDEVIQAIKAHNYMHTDQIPTTALDKALHLIETEYPINEWNVYVIYVSDGEDFDPDKTCHYIEKLFDKKVNIYDLQKVLACSQVTPYKNQTMADFLSKINLMENERR